MNLERAIQLVIDEAESSALGDENLKVLYACEIVEAFYNEYGHQFSNFSVDIDD